jgi:hypothetical protein
MSKGTPFIALAVAYRVLAVRSVRRRLYELAEEVDHPLPEDPPLSKPAEAWLERLSSALSDPACTTASVQEMDEAMRESLSPAESKELRRRLSEFVALRDAIPPAATSTKQAMPAVLETLLHLSKAAA